MATPAWLQKGSIQRPKEQLKDAAAQSEKAQPGVSMYTALPDGEVAIEEFERFAMDRLRGAWAGPAGCGSSATRLAQAIIELVDKAAQAIGGAAACSGRHAAWQQA